MKTLYLFAFLATCLVIAAVTIGALGDYSRTVNNEYVLSCIAVPPPTGQDDQKVIQPRIDHTDQYPPAYTRIEVTISSEQLWTWPWQSRLSDENYYAERTVLDFPSGTYNISETIRIENKAHFGLVGGCLDISAPTGIYIDNGNYPLIYSKKVDW